MGWTAPRTASACQDGRCQTHLKGSRPWASLSGICRLSRVSGSIWRKTCFRFTPSTRRARSSWRASSGAARCSQFFAKLAAVRGGDGGVLFGASLGAGADRARPRGEADPAGAREALCAAQQERRRRRGGDLRGGGAAGQRFVPVRSVENQAELMRHRARELLAGSAPAAQRACAAIWPRSASWLRRARSMRTT